MRMHIVGTIEVDTGVFAPDPQPCGSAAHPRGGLALFGAVAAASPAGAARTMYNWQARISFAA